MDFDAILGSLPPYETGEEAVVATPEFLRRKAAAMQRRGYRHTRRTLEVLEAYVQGYGILLSGGVGVGKTFFFQTVNPEPIALLSFNQCNLWKYDKLEDWLVRHRGQEIVLDDIGWDAGEANNFGTRFETLQIVLDYRLTESAARTHVTTNMSNDELIRRYDAHCVDRIYQCCRCFRMDDTDSKRVPVQNQNYLRNLRYDREMGREQV